MDRPGQLVTQHRIDRALSGQPSLTRERLGHDQKVEMTLSPRLGIDPPFVMMAGVPPAVELNFPPAAFTGRDPLWEKAVELLREKVALQQGAPAAR